MCESTVAPYVGAWIETQYKYQKKLAKRRTLRGCVDWNSTQSKKIGGSARSHPTWVRGLKLSKKYYLSHIFGRTLRGCVDWNTARTVDDEKWNGRTLRGCVDWNSSKLTCWRPNWVAPYVGAWIETDIYNNSRHHRTVAPYVGAWIETIMFCITFLFWQVAPYVGAWIETQCPQGTCKSSWSHPTWVRGLKLNWKSATMKRQLSHPTWVRGLKLGRPSKGNTRPCRTLRGCVDWNMVAMPQSVVKQSRTLRGCVDWNTGENAMLPNALVAPYVGAWIETRSFWASENFFSVAPYVGAWIETIWESTKYFGTPSRTLRGCVDWNISLLFS